VNAWFAAAGCAGGVPVLAVLLLRLRFAVVHVQGNSMLPALRPGDRLLVRQARLRRSRSRLRAGTLIVVRRPAGGTAARGWRPAAPRLSRDPWIVKRVAALPGDVVPHSMRAAVGGVLTVPDRMLLVSADNPAGTDSRQWGFMPDMSVLGPVVRITR
jgi:signal peptidase I